MAIKTFSLGYTVNIGNYESLKVAMGGELSEGQTLPQLRNEVKNALATEMANFAEQSDDFTRAQIDKFMQRIQKYDVNDDSGW